LKKIRNGFAPKQTIAITMLSKDELCTSDFISSKLYTKMNKMMYVPYYREGNTITYMNPTIIDLSLPEYTDLFHQLESDYQSIKTLFLEEGRLESRRGIFLQNRTKGKKNSTSRAFYLRPLFMKNFVTF